MEHATRSPNQREGALDPLRTCLLELLFELRNQDIPLSVGGRFRLLLKRERLADHHERTLFAELPNPPATNDIVVFFRDDQPQGLRRRQRGRHHPDRPWAPRAF